MKRYIRADKPPPDYVTMNKKNIKNLETTVKILQHAGTVGYTSKKTLTGGDFYSTQQVKMRTTTFGGVAAASLSPMRKNYTILNEQVDLD